MRPSRSQPQRRSIIQLGLLAFVVLLALNFQALLDQYALLTFRPSGQMAEIEAKLTLTSAARAKFYRAKPQLDKKAAFNADCQTQPHELELGCYYRGRIYVLLIDNDSLAPEMEVVAAHELLHAVWAGLSASERNRLSEELERVYGQLANDELKGRMANYAQTEPGEESNELHSILGTEYANLSPLLEEHYAQYFQERKVIVAAHELYEGVFTARRQELERELAEIRVLKGQLGALNRQLEAYRAAGQIGTYNALVPQQNDLVDDINQRIGIYRQGVDEYNDLSKSLDSQEITDTEAPA